MAVTAPPREIATMSAAPSTSRHLVVLLRALLLGGFVLFAVRNRSTLATTGGELAHISPGPVLLGVCVSLGAVVNRGQLNVVAHRAVGLVVDRIEMTRTAAVSFTANKLFKSGGATGVAVIVRDGQRRGLAGGAVLAACALAAASTYAALGLLLAVALLVLATTGRLTGWWIAAGGGFGVCSIAVVATTLIVLRTRQLGLRLWKLLKRGQALVLRRELTETNDSACTDLYDALAAATSRPRWLVRLLCHSLASKALGALMLVAATSGAGLPISLAEVIVAYSTALIAAYVSFLPAGVGLVEASTAAILVSQGAPLSTAALAVALFRILDLWLPLTFGAVIGRRELGRHSGARRTSESRAV